MINKSQKLLALRNGRTGSRAPQYTKFQQGNKWSFTVILLVSEELSQQSVTSVQRIIRKGNGVDVPTSLILTFSTPTVHERIKIYYFSVHVQPYKPNPRRCFHYQRFGYNKIVCTEVEKFINCKGPH